MMFRGAKPWVLRAPARFASTAASFDRIGVVGAGQMGTGIALVAAVKTQSSVRLMDLSEAQLQKSIKFARSLLDKDIAKNKISKEAADAAFARIKPVTSLRELKECDFVVEAAAENFAIKQSIFKELSDVTAPSAILASNTSSISITKIASTTNKPQNVIGMHFMNPVPVMKLVEIIPGLATGPSTEATTVELAHAMGKTVTKSQDVPGFIANRLLMPFINEAVVALQENIASKEHIDLTMKLGTNHPMGPLALADHIGLDTCLAIMKVLHSQLGEDKYRPAWLLNKYVDAGWLGKKTGQGFYKY